MTAPQKRKMNVILTKEVISALPRLKKRWGTMSQRETIEVALRRAAGLPPFGEVEPPEPVRPVEPDRNLPLFPPADDAPPPEPVEPDLELPPDFDPEPEIEPELPEPDERPAEPIFSELPERVPANILVCATCGKPATGLLPMSDDGISYAACDVHLGPPPARGLPVVPEPVREAREFVRNWYDDGAPAWVQVLGADATSGLDLTPEQMSALNDWQAGVDREAP